MTNVYSKPPVAIGNRYGKRVVFAEAGMSNGKSPRRKVLVRCDCGDECAVLAADLTRERALCCRTCRDHAHSEKQRGVTREERQRRIREETGL